MGSVSFQSLRGALSCLTLLVALVGCRMGDQNALSFDVVINEGRVMDPESGLDAVRSVGIRDGRVVMISQEPLQGATLIDAGGKVVAPGFVDLHAHGQNPESYGLMVRDGVTTGLELEVGVGNIAQWYAEREGGQLINFGASIGHIPVRMKVMGDPGQFLPSGPANTEAASSEQIAEMARLIAEGLKEGAVAVGFGLAYTPAATSAEFGAMMSEAAKAGAAAHIHVRGGVAGAQEAIETAARTGTALHLVHANSSGGEDIVEFLEEVEAARKRGQDVTTEAYPYEAGMTAIESALFDDWQEWDDEQFGRHQWALTGEFLTRETFGRYREQGGFVAIHSRTPELTRIAIAHPLTMIASDGGVEDGKGHPRTSGTYSKVLGKFVREEGLITLMDALRRMTVEPARRMEAWVPEFTRKGRLSPGADADIVIFDPGTVIDQSTYLDPTIPAMGIVHVFVNGVVVVRDGELVPDVRPGKAMRVR